MPHDPPACLAQRPDEAPPYVAFAGTHDGRFVYLLRDLTTTQKWEEAHLFDDEEEAFAMLRRIDALPPSDYRRLYGDELDPDGSPLSWHLINGDGAPPIGSMDPNEALPCHTPVWWPENPDHCRNCGERQEFHTNGILQPPQ